ncbi:unnamed protein product [Periconia digitata]|uniref:Phenazine biosynthesis-like protein n=1 Tax=Periconia digitata TaxID=1303443 RepID=A0A9W4XWG6_9PLEO|nr:unnamed protein product [Periconia digitata]
MQLPYTTLDVFTTKRYLGNPLAVIRVPSTLSKTLTEAQKQTIAKEFNYSESVFLHEPTPEEPQTAVYDIFTPSSRMTFAGHPTIGTAIYVATHAAAYPGVTQLRTLAGTIPFTTTTTSEGAKSEVKTTVAIPHDVREHKTRLPHPYPAPGTNGGEEDTVPLFSIVKGMAFNLIPMKDVAALALPKQGLIPQEKLYAHECLDQGSGWDIGYTGSFFYVDLGTEEDGTKVLRTRMLGTREDAGTGSASCALTSYLALKAAKGKAGVHKFHMTQGVEMGRRCDIYVNVTVKEGGEEIERVEMAGAAMEVMEGTLRVD